MRIVVAPDAFKESMSASEAARAIARGVERGAAAMGARVEIDACPVSDGGAGLVDAFAEAMRAERRTTCVCGPLGEPVMAEWATVDERAGVARRGLLAVIELSSAAGLPLVARERRNPERTTTYGVGELVRAALDAGATRIALGVGNSATCDGGAGMGAALGASFLDERGGRIDRPRGGDLMRIARIDIGALDARLARTEIVVACDVNNPLFGPEGAAHVFAPQKGAAPEQVERLDAGLRNLARRCAEAGINADPDTPGSGAAGGVGFGARAFLGAAMRSGAELVLERIGFEQRVRGAALVITGEGRLDGQSLRGKLVVRVAEAAQRAGAPTVALVGAITEEGRAALRERGGPLGGAVAIADPTQPLEMNLKNGPALLEAAAERVVRERQFA